jgi:hypothetical protein
MGQRVEGQQQEIDQGSNKEISERERGYVSPESSLTPALIQCMTRSRLIQPRKIIN